MAHPVAASPQAQALAALIRATLAQTRPWPHRDSLVGIVPAASHLPLELLTDTRLAPADKLAWWAIAQFSPTDHAITPFPELAALARLVNVNSPKTVARALIMLRLTGWLTRARYRIDNAPARHLSLLHAAPLTWTDAVYLDPTLPAFVADMQRHSHAQVRKMAAAIAAQAAQFTVQAITAEPVCAGIESDLPPEERQNLPLPFQPEVASDGVTVKFAAPVDDTAPSGLPKARQILPSVTSPTDAVAEGASGSTPDQMVREHATARQSTSGDGQGAHVAIETDLAPVTNDTGCAQIDLRAQHRRQNLPPPLQPEATSDGAKAKFTGPADSVASPGPPSARQILPSVTSPTDALANDGSGIPPDPMAHGHSSKTQSVSGGGEGKRADDEADLPPFDVDFNTTESAIADDQRGQNLPLRCSSYINKKTTTTPTNVAGKICPSSPSELIYPARLTADMRQLIQAEVEKLSPPQRQAVLDELEGRFRAEQLGAPPVFDELRYLQRLCRLVKRGRFKRNLGLKVQHQREQRAQEEARRRQARSELIDDAQRRERQQARWRGGDNPLAEARRVLGMPDRQGNSDDEPDPS